MNNSEHTIIRYSLITKKNPREIVMLRGTGCQWRKCRFCDYHLDFSKDVTKNYQLNHSILTQVTGKFHRLEVINSGSFVDLDEATLLQIESICLERQIKDLHFECHWMHRNEVIPLRERFEKIGINVHIKTGVETFDTLFRETVLCKGFDIATPSILANYFDEVCLLQGISGQTVTSMRDDIETGLAHFQRVCVNIMVENSTQVKPDSDVIKAFYNFVYPHYKENDRIDILLENTDFGVGSTT
ncbi:MAG: radical SAM protein [Velocimicrobium sp.]